MPALDGMRVLDMTQYEAGTSCTQLLAWLGAEVVKIEPPTGDIARRISPHSVGPHNAYFASLNRNKKSVVLDLADDGDKARFHQLVKSAQGLITNMRPSAILKAAYGGRPHTWFADCAGLNSRKSCTT